MEDDLLFLTDTIDNLSANTEYELLPAGTYPVTIIGVEKRETRAQTGYYLAFTFEVASGAHQGRRLWSNVNIENRNPKAQEIGQRELKTIKDMCGIDRLRSSTQLLGHLISVKVEVEPRNDKPDVLQNVVKFVSKPASAGATIERPATPSGVPAAAAAQSGAASAPAWRSRATVAA